MRVVGAIAISLVAAIGSAAEIPMVEPRTWHTATSLRNGDILIVGGDQLRGTTEYFRWRTNRFEPGPRSPAMGSRGGHSAVLLGNTVFVFGGNRSNRVEWYGEDGAVTLADVHLVKPREVHTATLLDDGSILIVGGRFYDVGGFGMPRVTRYFQRTAELYRPFAARTELIDQIDARSAHTATKLRDGTVLVTGGVSAPDHNGSPPAGGLPEPQRLASVEMYIPAERRFIWLPSLRRPRSRHTATLLPDGRVLIAGGDDDGTAELYEPAAKTSTVLRMIAPRYGHTATLLPNGNVILIGGSSHAQTEIFDPRSGEFVSGPLLKTPRRNHTTNLLPDGRLLVVGGATTDLEDWIGAAETLDTGSRRRAVNQ